MNFDENKRTIQERKSLQNCTVMLPDFIENYHLFIPWREKNTNWDIHFEQECGQFHLLMMKTWLWDQGQKMNELNPLQSLKYFANPTLFIWRRLNKDIDQRATSFT